LPSADDSGLLAPGRVGSEAERATGDPAFTAALLDAEAALARAQAECGLLPATAAEAVCAAAADRARFHPRDLAERARSGGNPVIPLVADLTAAVRERDPAAAEYVHRGATSQDIMDTAAMLVASRALRPALADLRRAQAALAELAAAHRATPMPGRTLTQHAVPTTFGLKAAGWRALVLDAHDRLAAVRAALPAQLGGAAGTLAAFGAFAGADSADPGPRLASAFARATGLAEPALPWHTLRTPIADLGAALAFTAAALGKIAEDVALLGRPEIGEVREGGGGGSSAMPHKSNPVRTTLIAAAARQVPALAAILTAALTAQDERPAGAWHAEWQPLREALRTVGGACRDAADLTEGLRVDPARMRANLDLTGGAPLTERLAAELADRIGRAPARDALTRAARRSAQEGIGLAAALAGEDALAGALSAHEVTRLLDPAGYLGSAGALVDRALRRRPHPQEAP
jgi:3-carboxy-cis,cis-muconate cycloisomerase